VIRNLSTLLLVLIVTGCVNVFVSYDVYRPLPIDDWQKSKNAVDEYATRFAVTDEAVRKSFGSLNSPARGFTIRKYSDWTSYLYFPNFNEAIKQFPQNPFAWSLLANYLLLQRQPAAAAAAAEIALSSINGAYPQLNSAWPSSDDDSATAITMKLKIKTEINAANFLNLCGRYDRAIEVSGSIERADLPWPIDLARVWATSIAGIGKGSGRDIEENLAFEQHRFEDKSDDGEYNYAYDYPQLFDKRKRDSTFGLLRGEALISIGDLNGAIDTLNRSLSLDSETWDSQLALASALFANGQVKEATAQLNDLSTRMPKGMVFREEMVRFNLGNALLKQNRLDDAQKQFELVLTKASERYRTFKREIVGELPPQLLPYLIDEKHDRVVGGAYNNLGTIHLQRGQSGGSHKEIDLAIGYFLNATDSLPGTAWANIARAEWLLGRKDEFVRAAALAIGSNDSLGPVLNSIADDVATVVTQDEGSIYEVSYGVLNALEGVRESHDSVPDSYYVVLDTIGSVVRLRATTDQTRQLSRRVESLRY
jgi:tetratricopeptide (TPR) repeat protein